MSAQRCRFRSAEHGRGSWRRFLFVAVGAIPGALRSSHRVPPGSVAAAVAYFFLRWPRLENRSSWLPGSCWFSKSSHRSISTHWERRQSMHRSSHFRSCWQLSSCVCRTSLGMGSCWQRTCGVSGCDCAIDSFAFWLSGTSTGLNSLSRWLLLSHAAPVYFLIRGFAPGKAGGPERGIFRLLLLGSVLSAAYGIIDFVWPIPLAHPAADQFIWLEGAVVRRAQGVFYESSNFANFCGFFLTAASAAFLGAQRAFPRSSSLTAHCFHFHSQPCRPRGVLPEHMGQRPDRFVRLLHVGTVCPAATRDCGPRCAF